MAEKLICPICGEPTRVYMGNARKDRLCGKHADMLKAGDIALCEKCGKYHAPGAACTTKTKYTELPSEGFETCVICGASTKGYAFCKECFKKHDHNEMLAILNGEKVEEKAAPKVSGEEYLYWEGSKEQDEKTDELTCLICKEPSSGKHFCSKCWKEYFSTYGKNESKTKKITIVIDNNLKCEIIDKYGNKNTVCASGALVRSDCEARIADKLYEHKICVAYEKVVAYDDEATGERKLLHPDFYLPEEDLYIEYNGMTGKEYLKKKEYTERIYKSKGLNILTMSHDDLRDLEGFLAQHLRTWK